MSQEKDLGATPQRSMEAGQAVPTPQLSHAAPTPGPWRVSMSGYSIKSNDDDMPIIAHNPWGVRMREKDAPQWIENAEFIVRACNSHYDLLAALKQLRIDANRLCDRSLGGTYEEDCRRSLVIAADAISKAEGHS